jgi:predicted MFS family arabinose efflux permease
LTDAFGWQGTAWFLAISGAVLFLILLLFLPETMRSPPPPDPVDCKISSETCEKTTKWEVCKAYFVEPLKAFGLLRWPPVLVAILYGGVEFNVMV